MRLKCRNQLSSCILFERALLEPCIQVNRRKNRSFRWISFRFSRVQSQSNEHDHPCLKLYSQAKGKAKKKKDQGFYLKIRWKRTNSDIFIDILYWKLTKIKAFNKYFLPLDLDKECCFDGDIQSKLGFPQSKTSLHCRITFATVNGRITHLRSRTPAGNWDAIQIQSKHGDSQWKEL